MATQEFGCCQTTLASALQAQEAERCAATAGDNETVAIEHDARRFDNVRCQRLCGKQLDARCSVLKPSTRHWRQGANQICQFGRWTSPIEPRLRLVDFGGIAGAGGLLHRRWRLAPAQFARDLCDQAGRQCGKPVMQLTGVAIRIDSRS